MFRRLHAAEQTIQITVNGVAVEAAEGDMVATALLLAGIQHFRTTAKLASPRGPYCSMGVCFECLVTIDGIGNRQACLIPVHGGMVVETGAGSRDMKSAARP
jgi:D-hydroxyproline dehydrogenase subunit gamma